MLNCGRRRRRAAPQRAQRSGRGRLPPRLGHRARLTRHSRPLRSPHRCQCSPSTAPQPPHQQASTPRWPARCATPRPRPPSCAATVFLVTCARHPQCALQGRGAAKPCRQKRVAHRSPPSPTLQRAAAAPEMSKADAATLPLGPAKPAARPAAPAAPADAWSIPAVQPRASECGHTTSQQGSKDACCTATDAAAAPAAEASTTATSAPCLSLDLELSPEEVRGWVAAAVEVSEQQ